MIDDTKTPTDEAQVNADVAASIHVEWQQPYRGQSRPIERAFKDFAQDHGLSRHAVLDNARSQAAKAIVSKAPRR